ncbi:hypothetical protein BDR04DRAFT_1111875 [Suillus decipiens]|nr:hypothetical protein BDR04DRAFT_1111880 [Suillus decipiens]KAG2062994.1 hypothetical protein BDR04DRAFT_1111875 [Suillus decipiens]
MFQKSTGATHQTSSMLKSLAISGHLEWSCGCEELLHSSCITRYIICVVIGFTYLLCTQQIAPIRGILTLQRENMYHHAIAWTVAMYVAMR